MTSETSATAARRPDITTVGILIAALLVGLLAISGIRHAVADSGMFVKPVLPPSANDVCISFVRGRLNMPGVPLTYPYYIELLVSNSTYTVQGTVDAPKTKLGGLVRIQYACTIHRDGNTWHLDDLQIWD